MTTQKWLEALDQGHIPDDPRQDAHLRALRDLGLVESAPSTALTPWGRELAQHPKLTPTPQEAA